MIINFVVLLVVLYKILFKPVRQTMEDRQKSIAAEIEKAEKQMELAESMIREYEAKKAELQKKESNILDSARKSAQEEKEKLLESFRQESEEKKQYYIHRAEDEYQQLEMEFRKLLGHNSVKIADRILQMAGDENLSESFFRHFLKKVASLREELNLQYKRDEIPPPEENVILISASPMTEDQKNRFEKELQSQFDQEYRVSYVVDSRLGEGFELRFGSFTLHASIRRYLDEADEEIRKMLEAR